MKSNYQDQVFSVVKKIPQGKVATYGQVAAELQSSKFKVQISPRMVGWALHQNKDPKTPCHRVVDRNGRLAQNFAFGGWQEQKRRLEKEGINFIDNQVELSRYRF